MASKATNKGKQPVTSSGKRSKAHDRNRLSGANDIVIAVMGMTGSGKSTFINHLVEDKVGIGHDLESHTALVQPYLFEYQGLPVTIVDTPGFDDTNKGDKDVLLNITNFMSQTYKANVTLTGIIYLHRITDRRMTGSSLKNMKMFKALCGEEFYKHVALVTTMWGSLTGPGDPQKIGEERERQLVEKSDWWGMIKERGGQVLRHRDEDARASALEIIGQLIERKGHVVLDIQREMVDEGKTLVDTAAGSEINKEYAELQREFREELRDLNEAHKDALRAQDKKLADSILKERDERHKLALEYERASKDLLLSQKEIETKLEHKYVALKEENANKLALLQEKNERRMAELQKEQAQQWQKVLNETRKADTEQFERRFAAAEKERKDEAQQWQNELSKAERRADDTRKEETNALERRLEAERKSHKDDLAKQSEAIREQFEFMQSAIALQHASENQQQDRRIIELELTVNRSPAAQISSPVGHISPIGSISPIRSISPTESSDSWGSEGDDKGSPPNYYSGSPEPNYHICNGGVCACD